MMKTRWKKAAMGLTATLSAWIGLAVAQDSEAFASPAMWRVADADSEFILLGTFHILPPDYQWRSPALEAAIENADTVYFEADTESSEAKSKTINTVMLDGFNQNGRLLTDMLMNSDAQKLRDIVNNLGLSMTGVDAMRPWNAFLTLSVQFIVKKGFDPAAGVDSVLMAEMRTRGKKLAFFETVEDQLKLFTELDPQTEKALLVLTLRDWDDQTAAFDDLFKAWAHGDIDLIDKYMNEDMREQAPAVYKRLIVDRNKAWAETLDKALREGSGKALVAVGTAHLAGGATSLPALLAARGYQVSRYGGDGESIRHDAAVGVPAADVDGADIPAGAETTPAVSDDDVVNGQESRTELTPDKNENEDHSSPVVVSEPVNIMPANDNETPDEDDDIGALLKKIEDKQ